jgi:hypothetical protein
MHVISAQTFSGISFSTFNSTRAASILTIQDTVAASINSAGVTASDVIVNSVIAASSSSASGVTPQYIRARERFGVAASSSAILATYTVSTTDAVGFSSSQDAYTQFSANINAAVASGQFDTYLASFATTNQAAGFSNVTASEASFVPLLPTAMPTSAPGSNSQKLSDGAVAGIVIGVIAFCAIIAGGVYAYRKRRSDETLLDKGSSSGASSGASPISPQRPAPYVPPTNPGGASNPSNPNSAF